MGKRVIQSLCHWVNVNVIRVKKLLGHQHGLMPLTAAWPLFVNTLFIYIKKIKRRLIAISEMHLATRCHPFSVRVSRERMTDITSRNRISNPKKRKLQKIVQNPLHIIIIFMYILFSILFRMQAPKCARKCVHRPIELLFDKINYECTQ